MTIFNLLMVIVVLALFVVLMGRILKRIKDLELRMDELSSSHDKLAGVYVKLDSQLNDVRKSLDNY